MRPRSKLMDKRRLQLPTIKEGSEEPLRDPHLANTSLLHRSALSSTSSTSSSQDYLLSICHLAHPTFPAPPGGHAPGSRPRGTGGAGGGGAGQTLGGADPLESLYGGPAVASSCWEGGGGEEEEGEGEEGQTRRRRRRSWGGRTAEGGLPGCRGDEDDRDAGDRGRRRARANSVPRLTGPEPGPSGPRTPTPPAETPPVERPAGRPAEGQQQGGRGQTEGAGQGSGPRGKPSLLAQWLSECKAVWRQTGVKVCLLPAIAET